MSLTNSILAGALAIDPARPLITYYDDASDARAELSGTTLSNWVAKTANLLQDELDLEAGSTVAVLLPAHWQTAAILLAAWSVGTVVGTDPDAAEVTFCRPDDVAAVSGSAAGEIVSCPLHPLGLPQPPPSGALDFSTATLAQPDAFAPYVPVPEDAPALPDRTGAQVHADARERGRRWELESGDRVLSTLPWAGPADWIEGLLAVLAAGASLVLSPDPASDRLPGRATAEKITASLGTAVPGIRELAR